MKKLILILTILTVFCSANAVLWRLELFTMEDYDWWGATLTLKVNGVTILDHVSYGWDWDNTWPSFYDFNVENGDQITTIYTPAEMFDNENGYLIQDHLGQYLVISGVGYTSPYSITTPIVVSIPTGPPVAASNPYPADDALDVGLSGSLRWNFGAETEAYELWFGPIGNMNLVASGSSNATGSYSYGYLTPYTEYCWQVKSTNFISRLITLSPVWSFETTSTPISEYPYFEGFEWGPILPIEWSTVEGSGNWYPNSLAGSHGSGGSIRARFRNISGSTPFHMVSPPLSLWDMDAIDLSFDYAYATYANREDKLEVFYSTDYGVTYQLLTTMLGGATGELNTGGTVATDFVPSYGQWRTKTISVPRSANKIRFTATSANGNNLYLDEITLQQGNINTELSYEPTSIEFTDQSVGDTSDATYIYVFNTGTDTMVLPLSGVYITGEDAGSFYFNPNYFPLVIPANSLQLILCKFIPISAGEKTAYLHLFYHGEDHIVTLSGESHSSTDFWQRFEAAEFPPEMWSQDGGFEIYPGISIHGEQSACLLLNISEPEHMLITPVLDLDGTINKFSYYTAAMNNTLGYGSSSLQLKYQLYNTDTWTDIGNLIQFSISEDIRKETINLTDLPHGLYRFAFYVSTTFNYGEYVSLVVIDDVSGPKIHNNGVLEIPEVEINLPCTLSWNPIVNALHYKILSSDEPTGPFTELSTTTANNWQDIRPEADRMFYRVQASGQFLSPRSYGISLRDSIWMERLMISKHENSSSLLK